MPEGLKLRGDTGETTEQGDTLKTDATGETPHKLKGEEKNHEEKIIFADGFAVFC